MDTLNKIGLVWKTLIPASIITLILTPIFHWNFWLYPISIFAFAIGFLCFMVWGMAKGGM